MTARANIDIHLQIFVTMLESNKSPCVSGNSYLETRRQGANKLDSNTKSDEGGHRTMRNGGGKEDLHIIRGVIHLHILDVNNFQLFESERVLWIVDLADEM